MNKLASALTLAASLLIGASQASAAIVVDFSFTGSPLEPGAVTGHLTFDAAGTNVQATGVYIDSATGTVPGFETINFLDSARVTQNAFTVAADGTITSAALSLSSTHAYANVGTTWVQLNGFGGYNDIEQDYTQYYNGGYFKAIQNQANFAGVTYTPQATAAVPEPAVWATLTLGFGLIGGAVRRRRTALRLSYAG